MNFYQQPFGIPYNSGFYQQPVYPQFVYADQLQQESNDSSLMRQQSYIENILRLNLGKVATVYMNFENSQWDFYVLFHHRYNNYHHLLLFSLDIHYFDVQLLHK